MVNGSLSIPVLESLNASNCQMYTSMLGNLTPEIVENMTEQFRSKLSQEDVQNARQAMSSLSPGDLDEMVRSCPNYASCDLETCE